MPQHVPGHIEGVLGDHVRPASQHRKGPRGGDEPKGCSGADPEVDQRLKFWHTAKRRFPRRHDKVNRVLGHRVVDVHLVGDDM